MRNKRNPKPYVIAEIELYSFKQLYGILDIKNKQHIYKWLSKRGIKTNIVGACSYVLKEQIQQAIRGER